MTYTEQCAPLIRHIHCAMEKEANNKLREMDLTVSQIYLLQALNHAPAAHTHLHSKNLNASCRLASPPPSVWFSGCRRKILSPAPKVLMTNV